MKGNPIVRRARVLLAVGVVAVLPLIVSCGGEQTGEPAKRTVEGETERLQIAVVPKATAFTFWNAIHAGAAKAAEELDVDIIWMGPATEGERRQQIEVVQNFISRGVDAIVLAPLDEVALVRPVEAAVERRHSRGDYRLRSEERRPGQLRGHRQPRGRTHGRAAACRSDGRRRQGRSCSGTWKARPATTSGKTASSKSSRPTIPRSRSSPPTNTPGRPSNRPSRRRRTC